MDQKIQKAQEFEERLVAFAVDAIKTAETLAIPLSVKDQLIRSATSIGANYVEALNAISKTDFRNKIYIAKKEAAEVKYWLRLSEAIDMQSDVKGLQSECQSILMILQKTVNTINDRRKSKDQ